MHMNSRKEQFLEYVILDYIDTAQPVSSFTIQRKYQLPYSSATIRNTLAELEEDGYLTQVHTSSGRIPTDQGYRYYVNRLLGRQEILRQYASVTHKLLNDMNTMSEIHLKLKKLLLSFAHESGNVAMGKLSSDLIFEEGMSNFLTQPGFSSVEFIRDALDDLEEIKSHIDEISQDVSHGSYKLYIGEESPHTSMHKYSVIVGKFSIDSDDGTIVVVGPKGMQYAKNIAMVEYMLNSNNYEDER
jgi:transcriptional regulator of heat shock response